LWPTAFEHWWRSPPAAANAAPSAARRVETAVRVTVETVEPRTLTELVNSTGTLLATESVELQAEVNGKITAINFVEGARVRKGALLVKLNDADLQARRLAAAHQVALAERRERRVAELLAQGFVIPDDHDQALNDVNVRRAELELTDAQIAETEIRAPSDGIAGLRYVSEGAFVNAATRIATLQRIDTLKVDFVPEKYLVASALRADFFHHRRARRALRRRVYAYDPASTPPEDAHAAPACALPEPRRAASAGVVRERRAHARRDRAGAPRPRRSADPGVQPPSCTSSSTAGRGSVKCAPIRTATHVEVLAGLEAGDTVVTSGLLQLRDGSPVVVELPNPTVAHR
jgi:membrane fusion protein (multidrug efflux system)